MVLVATKMGVGAGVASDLGWRGSDALFWGQCHFMSVVSASLSSEPPSHSQRCPGLEDT